MASRSTARTPLNVWVLSWTHAFLEHHISSILYWGLVRVYLEWGIPLFPGASKKTLSVPDSIQYEALLALSVRKSIHTSECILARLSLYF